jgi:fructose-1,6-bisphosphatase/inositol monophosphatase family enzyme
MMYNAPVLLHPERQFTPELMQELLISNYRNTHDLIKRFRSKKLDVALETKNDASASLVTSIDYDNQALLCSEVETLIRQGAIPSESGVIGEENSCNTDKRFAFIVDPIDGTSELKKYLDNSEHPTAQFGCSIGVYDQETKEYVAGGILLHRMKLILVGGQTPYGSLVWRRSLSSRSTQEVLPHDTVPQTGRYVSHRSANPQVALVLDRIYARLADQGWQGCFDGCGVFQLAMVHQLAIGSRHIASVDFVLNGNAGIWDIAGAQAILEMLRGSVTDWEGKRIIPNLANHGAKYPHLAGSHAMTQELASLIADVQAKSE